MKPSTNLYLVLNQKAGGYTLPADLTAAYTATTRLAEHTIPPPTQADPVPIAVGRLLEAARSGSDLLTRVDASEHRSEQDGYTRARAALQQAQDQAQGDFDALVEVYADRLVTDHLAPEHERLIAEARTVGAGVEQLTTTVAVAQADASTRAGVVRFAALVDQYAVLRDTWSRLTHRERDWQYPTLARLYAEVKNPADVWPDFTRLQHQVRQSVPPPWQLDTRGRLLWFATNPDAQAWMPTPAQLNAHVAAAHADELQDWQRGVGAYNAVRAWAGGN